MTHYTCDGCGLDLTNSSVERFMIRIDSTSNREPNELSDDDLDHNVVEETAALLKAIEDGLANDEELTALPYRATMEYDLCPTCFGNYLKDPIGRAGRPNWAFSPN
jgi:hypothetical protein